LVPLTNSLYVPGKLCDPDHVIVDVGTGYFVRKVRLLLLPRFYTPLIAPTTDARTGFEALLEQSRIHPQKLGNAGGDDFEEAGKYEFID
jgi:hypothetical protein